MITEFDKYKQDEPIIKYYKNGQKKSEHHLLNGEYHREDGPAYQIWYNNGKKKSEEYYLNGEIHREDGPAYQRWYENGQKESEEYHLNGEIHREDGPAVQWWHFNGKKGEEYCLNSKEYSRSEWLEKLKEIGSSHYKEQKLKYEIEQYNI